MVFPASFTTTTDTVATPGTLSVVAVVLLALGYSLSVALWFICRSWLFQFDFIFMYVGTLEDSPELQKTFADISRRPCFLSSALGALNTAITLSIHPTTPAIWSTSSIASLALSLISSLIYAALSILTHIKIRSVSKSTSKRFSNPESATLLSEDENQRQQLLKLLAQKDASPRISPQTSASTFKIDIPDNARAARNPPLHTPLPLAALGITSDPGENTISHLAAPSATYESAERSRSTSSPSSRNAQYQQTQQKPTRSYHEDSVNARRAALTAARERERHNRFTYQQQHATLPAGSSAADGPPIVVNTRHAFSTPLSSIPLEDRHPLEQGEEGVDFVLGRGSKDKEEYERLHDETNGVWRAEDHDEDEEELGEREEDAGPAWEIVEGGDVVVDLGEFKRVVPVRASRGQIGSQRAVVERSSPVSALSPAQGFGRDGIGNGNGDNAGEGSSTGGSAERRWLAEELDSRERLELDGRHVRR